jgi:transporter family-2 protein
MQLIFIIIVGLIGGIAVGLQGPMSGLMSQRLGVLQSSFIIHLGGLLATLVPLLAISDGNLHAWRSMPWYVLAAGVLGPILYISLSYTLPHLGAATSILLLVAGQLAVGTMIDHFGWLGIPVHQIDMQRIVGISIVAIGVWLLVR